MFNLLFKKLKGGSGQKSWKDPVCRMLANDKIVFVYDGRKYSFCSEYCREQFEKNPESYTAK